MLHMVLVAGMQMSDPIPTFAEVVKCICDNHPNFAYIHVLEPPASDKSGMSNDILHEIWGEQAYIANNDFEHATAIETVEKKGSLVSFAHHFLANVGGDP
jgi:NADPH2 dehydrogenase